MAGVRGDVVLDEEAHADPRHEEVVQAAVQQLLLVAAEPPGLVQFPQGARQGHGHLAVVQQHGRNEAGEILFLFADVGLLQACQLLHGVLEVPNALLHQVVLAEAERQLFQVHHSLREANGQLVMQELRISHALRRSWLQSKSVQIRQTHRRRLLHGEAVHHALHLRVVRARLTEQRRRQDGALGQVLLRQTGDQLPHAECGRHEGRLS
mmetsp:Transcript_15773/g.60035  ORF Transcript_15773/g.60035 Transcript_15773/m.60035 type:complete len:209 (-) Transcript_15773:110-736(-)